MLEWNNSAGGDGGASWPLAATEKIAEVLMYRRYSKLGQPSGMNRLKFFTGTGLGSNDQVGPRDLAGAAFDIGVGPNGEPGT